MKQNGLSLTVIKRNAPFYHRNTTPTQRLQSFAKINKELLFFKETIFFVFSYCLIDTYTSLLNLPIIFVLRFYILNELLCFQWQIQINNRRYFNVAKYFLVIEFVVCSNATMSVSLHLLVFVCLGLVVSRDNYLRLQDKKNISRQNWFFITDVDNSLSLSVPIWDALYFPHSSLNTIS